MINLQRVGLALSSRSRLAGLVGGVEKLFRHSSTTGISNQKTCRPIAPKSFDKFDRCSSTFKVTYNVLEPTQAISPKTWDGKTSKESINASDTKSYFTLFLALISSGILMFISDRIFIVEAAKPIYDYGKEPLEENSWAVEKRIIDSKNETASTKKKKSKRERYNFIADVVEAVADTVVCIEIKDHASIDWFTGVPQTASNGSGFIISKDGLILTNAHVVATPNRKSDSISVRLSDGRTFAAHIEDIDYESDLATIRINTMDLPVMPLGSSSETKIGEWVVALGSPLSLTNTITAGVVSSVSRGASELGILNDINYIQTDAAITFGNSGGPLINLDGEAIGINSMKVTAGISFAIPIDHAKIFLDRADARKKAGKKKPARRYMGITILTVTDQIRRELRSRGGFAEIKHGVLVWQVVVGSPAYLAGIQPGDIITRINNVEITTSTDLYETAKTADKLNIHVQRDDKVYACVITPELVSED